ncbi:hypothetical protein [Hafnia sp.]|uniref:hypothetical protein n=1 Tax=Hafnia sp. TaxID=1873498 RepID=UPI002FCC6A91
MSKKKKLSSDNVLDQKKAKTYQEAQKQLKARIRLYGQYQPVKGFKINGSSVESTWFIPGDPENLKR